MAVEIAMPQTGQLPVVKGPEFNDRDRVNDILAYEKYLTTAYNTGLNEMQRPKLIQDVTNILNDVHGMQKQCFDFMFAKGWYKMKAADKQDISKTWEQFNGYKSQFPQW